MKCINIKRNIYIKKKGSAHKNPFRKIMHKDKQFINVKQIEAVVYIGHSSIREQFQTITTTEHKTSCHGWQTNPQKEPKEMCDSQLSKRCVTFQSY